MTQSVKDALREHPLLGTAAVVAARIFGGPWAALGAAIIVGRLTRPKRPEDPAPVTPAPFSTRQPIAPWQVILGRTRVGGVLTYRSVSADRRFWYMVLTFACHRCEAVDEVWFDDQRLEIDSSGNVLGKYAKEDAGDDLIVFQAPVPNTNPAEITIGDTIAALSLVTVDPNVPLVRPVQFFETTNPAPGAREFYRPAANVFRFNQGLNGKIAAITYQRANSSSFAKVKISLGTEGPTVQPFPDLVAETASHTHPWTNDHLQYGHTKLFVRLEASREAFPSGVPNVTIVARGAHLFDSRTGQTVYSNNAALAINHVLTEKALGYGLGADYATEVHNADMISAANSCDDAITVKLGATEPRYTVNGSFLTSETPKAILEQLLAACAGTLVNQGDKWHVSVGVYYPPTVTLTESHVAGPSEIVPLLPSREDGNANAVKGVYTSPDKNWQQDDFKPIVSSTFLADDNNERRYKDIDLGRFVTSHSQAQRLAKIDLLRLRQGLIERCPFKLAAWQVVPGRTVMRTDSQLGWSAKPFEVLESELAVVQDENGAVLQTTLGLRETAAAIYDWQTSEEQLFDLAPNTSLPDPGLVPPPGAPTIQEERLVSYDGRSVATKAIIAWVATTYPFAPRYQLEYKLTSASVYTVLPLTASTAAEIPDIAPGQYDFRVKAVGPGGAASEYAVAVKEIVGLTADPANVSGFFVTVHEGRARCHLDLSPDLDVRLGGRLWIRWSPLTVGALWNDGSLLKLDGYAGDSIVVEGPLYPGTYMAKYEDSTGHFSKAEASFVVTETLLSGFTTLNTVTFHPAFDGVKVNVAAPDGFLQLVGTMLWDSVPSNIDTWDRIDSLGGIAASGSCTFTTKQDLGTVKTVRLVPSIRTLAFDTGDTWDSRTTLMDSWGLVDGSVIEDAEIVAQVRATNDDPNGTPTWGPWHDLEVQDMTARGFEYRTLHTSGNTTHNRRLEQFSVAAKQPA